GGLTAAGASTHVRREVEAVPERPCVRTDDIQRRSCRWSKQRHREVLEERSLIAERLEADLAKVIGDVRGRIGVLGGPAYPPTASGIGEIADMGERARAIEACGRC